MTRPTPGRLSPGSRITPGKVSIVVLNWNARPFLERALRSIVRHTTGTFELVLVDNGSEDDSRECLDRFVQHHGSRLDVRRVDHPENLYFSRGFNEGFRASAPDSEFVVVFCNDVEVKEDGWLEELVRVASTPNTIAVGHAAFEYGLPDEHRETFRRNRPRYEDDALERRMEEAVADPAFRYTHLFGYCFLLNRRLIAESGLYLEGGDFKQYHSDWEWYVRFSVLGYEIASSLPRVHHWHSISELRAFHPQRYRDVLARLANPALVEHDLREGRPLYPEESGYRRG